MTLVDKVRAIVKGKDTYEKLWDKRNSLSRALSSLNSSENDELKRKKIYAEMADVALQQEDYKHAESYAFTSGDDTMERKVCAAIASQCERHGNYTYGAEIAIKGGLIDRAKALYEKEYRRTIYDFGVETEPDYGDTLGIFKHRAILMETPSYHGCEEQARYRCEILARICEKAAEIGGDLWLLRAEDLYRALGDEYVKSFQKEQASP